jgi:hypothetical protein
MAVGVTGRTYSFNVSMRAISEGTKGEVAIKAENSEPRWVSLLAQPAVKNSASVLLKKLTAMSCTVSGNMVYGKKFDMSITATGTNAPTVGFKSLGFKPLITVSVSKFCPFLIALSISLDNLRVHRSVPFVMLSFFLSVFVWHKKAASQPTRRSYPANW